MTLRIRSNIVRILNEFCTGSSHGLRTKEPVRLRGFAFRRPDSKGVDLLVRQATNLVYIFSCNTYLHRRLGPQSGLRFIDIYFSG